MKRAARRWWLAVGLAAVCVAGVCAQNPRGTQQKVGNPLNDLLNQAREAIARKDFEAALAPLQRVIAEQPDFAYAHFQLGYAFTGLKRWDDAKREYSRAAELDPRMAEAYLNLGMLLLGRERGAAVAPLRKAVELLPSQSRPRLLLGVALEETDDLAGAIDALKGAATLDPQDFDIRAELGAVFLRAQRCPEAEVEFRAALSLQPDSPAARLGLANALNARHKPEAAAAYRSYLERKPADKEARARLARLLSEAKQYDAALAELDRLEPDPDADSLALRADILIARKKPDDALDALRRAVALAPRRLDLREGLGRTYLEKKDYASAQKELQAVLASDRDNVPAWKDLSTAYYLDGNCPAALAALQELERREPLSAGAWFVRATCYDKLKNVPEAIAAYEKFREVDQGRDFNQDWQAEQRLKTLRRIQDKKH